MSASLVGSEMCIRDRLERRGRAEIKTSWVAGARWWGRVVRWCCGWAVGCLLYTSDAADDM
eukprot:9240183-Alexandrium_andersonii.AAC.1